MITIGDPYRHTNNQRIDTVLLQKGENGRFYPLQYMSNKTSPQQEKYSKYEPEVLVIIDTLKNFRNYLIGNTFKIVTDCAALQKRFST